MDTMKNKIISFIFSIIFIIIAGTFFHLYFQDSKKQINKNRQELSIAIRNKVAFKLTSPAENGSSWSIYLNKVFRSISGIEFIGLFSHDKEPLFVKSKLDNKQSTTIITNFKDMRTKTSHTFNSQINKYSSIQNIILKNGDLGNLLIIYSGLIYQQNRQQGLRMFLAISMIIILLAILLPMILSRIREGKKEPDQEQTVETITTDPNLKYLTERNALLESELESLSDFQNINFEASTMESYNQMVKFFTSTILNQMNAKYLKIFISDEYQSINLMENKNSIFFISDKQMLKIRKKIPEVDFFSKNRLTLPLNAVGVEYGFVKIIKRNNNLFQKDEIHKFSSLLKQLSLSLYNLFLHEKASTDQLTGLLNRRDMNKKLKTIIKDATSKKESISLAMLDIDNFKNVNDNYGHQSGDMILKQISEIIKQSIRKSDYAFRYGGEELTIVMPGTPIAIASNVMENLRDKIFKTKFQTTKEDITISISIGISEKEWSAKLDSDSLIAHADKALYLSKKNGRNMITRKEALIK